MKQVQLLPPLGTEICVIHFFTFSVADPGFPRGGSANPKGGAPTYYLANFSRKLHENEEILDQRGSARPSRSPLDPPLLLYLAHFYNRYSILGSLIFPFFVDFLNFIFTFFSINSGGYRISVAGFLKVGAKTYYCAKFSLLTA